jgi:hypothetical protein
MVKTIYYYYYLFYKNILKDNEPHMLATLAFSFSFSLLIIMIIDISMAYLFSLTLGKYEMIGINILVILVMYFKLHRNSKAIEIVNDKPMFFNSQPLSILITIFFFASTSSFLFWGSTFVEKILGIK